MTDVLAIDPGPERSAWCLLEHNTGAIVNADTDTNELLLYYLNRDEFLNHVLVIEKIESFGMPVGASIFETVYWSGRFHQASTAPVHRVTRREVKLHLCNSARAKDANVRAVLLDRYPGGKGTKKNPGPLYGFKADMWSALAVGVTWLETRKEGRP